MRPFVIVEGEVALEPGLQIFADEWLTAALLDRLKHHAHIVEFTGADSYRFRQWLQREG